MAISYERLGQFFDGLITDLQLPGETDDKEKFVAALEKFDEQYYETIDVTRKISPQLKTVFRSSSSPVLFPHQPILLTLLS